jgi:hypothetical protein
VYRDTATGYEYSVSVGRDFAKFTRMNPPKETGVMERYERSGLWKRLTARQHL